MSTEEEESNPMIIHADIHGFYMINHLHNDGSIGLEVWEEDIKF